jgi:ABC-type nitrate/sulfonate/bicarbonate transport system ATPase subunit
LSTGKILLEAKDLSKFYSGPAGAKFHVIEDLNFSFSFDEKGYIISLLSPISAGKTTLLKILSAIDEPTSGKVLLDSKSYRKPEGDIVLIPQKPSSYPWMSVKQNIEFAMSYGRANKDSTKYSVKYLVDLVGLGGYENFYPHDKVSGFRFRVSLARALAVSPKIILIDDSFAELSNKTKNEIYEILIEVSDKTKMNFIISTSSVKEAAILSDEIFLMKKKPAKIIGSFKRDAKPSVFNSYDFKVLREKIEEVFERNGEEIFSSALE